RVWRTPSALRVVYSNASDTGFGSYSASHGIHIAHGQWSPTGSVKSSTWRELRALTLTLKAFATELSNHRVRWFTDNQNVAHIIK
uniref:RNase H type-1 domain-containing protein n=1 Tax=Amphimedon queenslandica TaxID=400682 RepID=A0A1X7UDE2_AMPQE